MNVCFQQSHEKALLVLQTKLGLNQLEVKFDEIINKRLTRRVVSLTSQKTKIQKDDLIQVV